MTARESVLPEHGPSHMQITPASDIAPRGRRRAVFIDRDGVINRRRLGLVRDRSQFHFLPGVLDALRDLAGTDFLVIVATNQEMVGANYIAQTELDAMHASMVEWAQRVGGRIDAVYACVHPRWAECDCSKPRPGMLTAAAKAYGIDLSASWMVGDNAKDLVAGKAAGTRTVLVDPRLRTRLQRANRHADAVVRDLRAAVAHVLDADGT